VAEQLATAHTIIGRQRVSLETLQAELAKVQANMATLRAERNHLRDRLAALEHPHDF
jgi:cell division protein FtsB